MACGSRGLNRNIDEPRVLLTQTAPLSKRRYDEIKLGEDAAGALDQATRSIPIMPPA